MKSDVLLYCFQAAFYLVAAQNGRSTPKYCGGKPADIILVMDSSGSIGNSDFEHQKNFVRGMIELFDVDSDKIRIGLVSYSNWAFPEFQLNTYSKKSFVLQAIDKVTHFKGDTNTGATLEYMRNVMFQPRNGARRGVPHIAIVLTDGRSNDPWRTIQQAQLAREDGITLFSIGVGHDLQEYELTSIASEPTSKYLFRVGDFLALQYIKEILAIEACKVPPPTINVEINDPGTTTTELTTTQTTTPPATTSTTTPTTTTSTTTPTTTTLSTTTTTTTTIKPRLCADADFVDVIYSLAPSSTPDEKAKSLSFLREVSSDLPIGRDQIRVGLVPDDCSEVSEVHLGQGASGDTENALNSIDHFINQATKVSFARQLKYIRKVSFSRDRGSRDAMTGEEMRKRAIIIINNRDDLSRAKREAYRLKKYVNAELFVIGVGTEPAFQKSVRDIVSKPRKSHVVFISNYDELAHVVNDVHYFICPSVY